MVRVLARDAVQGGAGPLGTMGDGRIVRGSRRVLNDRKDQAIAQADGFTIEHLDLFRFPCISAQN
jgi:hypothetical protein